MKKMCNLYTVMALTSVMFTASCTSLPTQSTQQVLPDSTSSNQMMQHLEQLQQIASKNGGNRAVGTKGGLASAQYILDQAKILGFEAQMLPFENREKKLGQNIVVEIKGQSKESAVIVGAHYDSVKNGPGINDNASGVALLLALMRDYATDKTVPKHTLYLAFWDSEEVGIAGSQAFAKSLTTAQMESIQAYINIDMVGTKNPEILIADADKSSVNELEDMLKERGMDKADYQPLVDGLRSVPSHTGDQALEDQLKAFFKSKNLKIKEDVSTLTASDTAPFLGKVPVASIIFFNEQLKGDVLEFAPCYHQACDTIDQIDPESLDLAYEAVVHLLSYLEKH